MADAALGAPLKDRRGRSGGPSPPGLPGPAPRSHSLRLMPTSFTDDLRLAHVLADDADSLSTSRYKALDLHVVNKPDLTPVTDADRVGSFRRLLASREASVD